MAVPSVVSELTRKGEEAKQLLAGDVGFWKVPPIV